MWQSESGLSSPAAGAETGSKKHARVFYKAEKPKIAFLEAKRVFLVCYRALAS